MLDKILTKNLGKILTKKCWKKFSPKNFRINLKK